MRKIRKKTNERSLEEGRKVLREARRGVLALNGDDGYPYALPINYIYDEERSSIYFHGAKKGHKIDSIKNSPKASFVVLGDEIIKDETWAPYIKSLIAFGKVRLVDDKNKSLELLRNLACKYYPSEELIDEAIEEAFEAVQMIVFEIEYMSVKEVQEK